MVKKIKIFDSFVFHGELDFLEFRLTELDAYVERFIIVEINLEGENSIYLKNKDRFQKWSEKISHISVTKNDLSFLNEITIEFINCKPNFEDVLMVSQINQVPNLKNKHELFDLLNYGSIILDHQNFVWNVDYIDNTWVGGTILCNFSQILISKKIIEQLFESKNNPKTTFQRIKNGWCFSNFFYDENFEKQIQEKLPAKDINSITTYQLINHKNELELPINIKLLPYVDSKTTKLKSHLFLVESENTQISYENYDSISIINFTTSLDEKIDEKISDKIKKHTLYLPNRILYLNNLSEFQHDYKLNEIQRMTNSLFLKKQDKLTIYYKNTLL